jgi:predicted nucleic acid-binding protein
LEALLEKLGGESVALAAITASELLHGVHRAEGALRRGRRERFVESVFRAAPVLPFTLEIARLHSRLWADLQRRGEMIGAHDLIIAATAVAHGRAVLTSDQRHFGRIETLKLELW